MANLRAKILDFRVFFLQYNLNSKGWNSRVHRGIPGNLESTHLSRDNASRAIGRIQVKHANST